MEFIVPATNIWNLGRSDLASAFIPLGKMEESNA